MSKEEIKENIKAILKFLGLGFIMIFVAGCIFGESDYRGVFLMSTYFVAFFGGLFIVFFTIIVVFNYFASRKLRINRLSKIDFVNDKELYRDILKNYSTVTLAYIDKMKCDFDISIVSGLLSLKNKGFIEITEDKINIIKYDFCNLELPERYIIENIKNGKVDIMPNGNYLMNAIFEECKRKELLVSNKNWLEVFGEKVKKLIFVVLISYLCGVVAYYIGKEKIVTFFDIVIKIALSFGWIYICFYGMNYQNNPYSRTEKAENLNEKLEGLKNYLKDYSLLADRDSEEIELWEDYLIYSVIFEQNKDIIKKYKKYYTN